jgi:hypothetical protein
MDLGEDLISLVCLVFNFLGNTSSEPFDQAH